METALAALIILTVVLYGAVTFAHDILSAQDTIMTSWREMEERLGERARTDLSAEATTDDGIIVTVISENKGSTKLADFDQWDVIVQYDSDSGNIVKWLSYEDVEPESDCDLSWWPGQDQWCKDIEDDFEPGIFNPGEVMTITIWVTPTVMQPTTNTVTIGTPNGISDTAVFTR